MFACRNLNTTINTEARTILTFGNLSDLITLEVVPELSHEIILGIPFLETFNPEIDWRKRRMNLSPPQEAVVRTLKSENLEPEVIPESESENLEPEVIPESESMKSELEFETLKSEILKPESCDRTQKSLEIPEKYLEYADVFDKKNSEQLPVERRDYDMDINLKDENVNPPFLPLYNLSEPELKALEEYVDENLKKGFIRKSNSPAGAPIFFVSKKDKSLRPCVDYRKLNEMTVKDRYPLPLISELIDRLGNAKFFTKIDLRGAYNLLRIKPGHEWKTAFRCRFGHFEYLVVPFGLTNAPAVFMRMMQDIFREYLDYFMIIFLDDILIFSADPIEHEKHVKLVLQKLRDSNLYAKLEKCSFDQKSVEFVGYIISDQGISMSLDKTKTIHDWKIPETRKAVRSFLGFINFYRKFIRNYSKIAKPLTDLTRTTETFIWNDEALTAFETLKTAVTSAPVLKHPDPRRPFILETDASDFAIGGALIQDYDNVKHPVAFYSRKLNNAEINYTVHDKELLGIVESLKHWRHYLVGSTHPIAIYSDHKNLLFFQEKRILSQRHARWAQTLSEYDFNLCYLPGKHNLTADALSRREDLAPEKGDESLHPRKFESTLLPEEKFAKLTTVRTDPESRKEIILEEEKLEILRARHDSLSAGHPGQKKTFELVAKDFYWPGMRTYINNYVDTCDTCQRSKTPRHKPYGLLKPLPIATRPWTHVSMDLIVKLPKSRGFDSIFVVVDRRTKMSHFIPCNETATAQDLATLYRDNVFKHHGLPEDIVSDRGPQFTSKFWKSLWKILGVKLSLSTSFHPQTDGQTERVNQTLEQYLRCFVDYPQKNWTDLLSTAEFAYNNAVHASTNVTPFEANYGFSPKADNLRLEESNVQSVHTHLENLEIIGKHLDFALKDAAETYKRFADKKRLHKTFDIGQKVWLIRKNVKTNRPSEKLDHRRLGPFQITEVINPVAYRLKLSPEMKIHDVFHVSLLENYSESSIPGRLVPPPPPILIDDNLEYEVEEILDSRVRRKKKEYLVSWKGYTSSENTWEPESNILPGAEEALEDYLRSQSIQELTTRGTRSQEGRQCHALNIMDRGSTASDCEKGT